MAKESKVSLEDKIKELNKKYGKGSVIGGKDTLEHLEVISSGSIALDKETGIGGIPVGKLIEIMGPESSGKSTLTLHIIANFQKAGKKAVLCDSEHSFDQSYARNLGVNVEELLIIQPESQEDGYNMIEELIDTGEIGLVIIDSHTSMMPRKVVDGDVGDVTIGLQARINSTALGKIKPLLAPNKCTVCSISQIRVNVGGYGDPNVSTGGLSYKFYADMRLKVSKQAEKEQEQNKTTVEIIKSKVQKPFGKAVFKIVWGRGIDPIQEILDYAVEFNIITKGGAWYQMPNDGPKLQGEEKVHNFLSDNEELFQEIKSQVLEKLKSND